MTTGPRSSAAPSARSSTSRVTADVAGIEIQTVGLNLMIVGVLGLVLGLFLRPHPGAWRLNGKRMKGQR